VKRTCVASQNWRWREARRSQYVDIGKPSDTASDDSGRNPCGWRGFGFWLQTLKVPVLEAAGSPVDVAKTVTAQRVFHYVMGSQCRALSTAT